MHEVRSIDERFGLPTQRGERPALPPQTDSVGAGQQKGGFSETRREDPAVVEATAIPPSVP